VDLIQSHNKVFPAHCGSRGDYWAIRYREGRQFRAAKQAFSACFVSFRTDLKAKFP